MTTSFDGLGQHNAVSTQYPGKTPSSEDLSEKGVVANEEFAQGHIVGTFNSRVAFLTSPLPRYPANITTQIGPAMELTLPMLILQKPCAKWIYA
jgi:hypothetical protein